MSKPVEYHLYELTRTEETESRSDEVLLLGLPWLDVRRSPRLKDAHPFFEEPLSFEVGETREVPLTDDRVRELTQRTWQIESRGSREELDDEEQRLLDFCKRRHGELEAAQKYVWSFTLPRTDYCRAGLVGRHLKLGEIGDDMEGLKASGIVSEEVAEVMTRVANRFSELRSELEGKGWTFDQDGTVWEPSTGGRPARYPRRAIRAYYRYLALQYMGSASDKEVVELIQDGLRPVFGDLTYAEVREAVKYERRREGDPTPPVPDSSE